MTGTQLTTVDFHGATLLAIRGETPADTLVAMKPVVDGMGLAWQRQLEKIKADPVLSQGITEMVIPSNGGPQTMVALPLSRMNFWLAKINANKVPNLETRAKVIQYQTECADVLFAHFFAKATGNEELIRRTDGIARMLAHKVTGIESEVGQIGSAVLELANVCKAQAALLTEANQRIDESNQRIEGLLLTTDARRGTGELVAVRQLLDTAKCLTKGRNSVARRLLNALKDAALVEVPPVRARRCPHTNVWLFPIDFANAFMQRVGNGWVSAHNSAVSGQGTLKLVSSKRTKAAEAPQPSQGA